MLKAKPALALAHSRSALGALALSAPLAVAALGAGCAEPHNSCSERWDYTTELPDGVTSDGPRTAVNGSLVLATWIERADRTEAGELRATLLDGLSGDELVAPFRIASGAGAHEVVVAGGAFHVYVVRENDGFVVTVDGEGNVSPRLAIDERVLGGAASLQTAYGSARLNLTAVQHIDADPALPPAVVEVNGLGEHCQSAVFDDNTGGILAACFFEDVGEGALVAVDEFGSATTLNLTFPGIGVVARVDNDRAVVVHVDHDVFATVVDFDGNVVAPATRIYTVGDDEVLTDDRLSVNVLFDRVIVTVPRTFVGTNTPEEAVLVTLTPDDLASAAVVDVITAARRPSATSNGDDLHLLGFVEQPDAFQATFGDLPTRVTVARTCALQ